MTDITELLYRIKLNITAIENGDPNESLLDEVRSDFLDMIELIKLFLISERDSYYGYFFMNMRFNVNFYANSIAGIKLNEFPPVFETNPLLLCKFSLKEILYVVCHEIDHVLLNHPAEMVKANPSGDSETFLRFNLAADAAVNDRINHEIEAENHHFMSQPDGVITSSVLGKMFSIPSIKEMENYAYYFKMISGKNNRKPDLTNGQQSMMSQKQDSSEQKDGSSGGSSENDDQNENQNNNPVKSKDKNPDSQNGSGNLNAEGKGENTPENGNGNANGDENNSDSGSSSGNSSSGSGGSGTAQSQTPVTAKNCGGSLSDHNWEAGDEEEATAAVKEFVNTAVRTMNDESRGLMPGHFMSQVELLNKPPKLAWQKILKKYIGTISENKRKTRTRLNRRQPERFDLSGEMNDKVLKIVVAIDTSGSVSDSMISNIMKEIFAILSKRKHEITIIECDAEVQRVYKVKTPGDVKKKVLGRGGTCFCPVIDYINDDKYYRDALLIYFTDGYGEGSIPRPKTYRNLWVVFGSPENLSVKEPYGMVLSI